MTGGGEAAGVGGPEAQADSLAWLRLGQARLLHARTLSSCLIVEGVVIYLTVLLAFAGDYRFAALWVTLASLMVGIVALYPRLAAPGGVCAENYRGYLRGHAAISAVTGSLWAGMAIAYLDVQSVMHMFVTINMVVAITVGGMLPSAEYRPTFVALLAASVLPFATYWLLEVDGPLRLIGVGLLIYFGFGLVVSQRAEMQTREALAAERQRKLSRSLEAKTEELERANFAKSRLLAATSHDMAQPMQAQGFLISALRTYLDRPEQTELLDRIEAAWRAQKELLDAVVDGARVQGGAVQISRRDVAVDALLDQVCSMFEAQAARRSVTLRVIHGNCVAHTDPAVLSRILRNLAANAVKFTQPGGQVELSSRKQADRVVVEVVDTGPGVSQADRARIFQAFVQLDSARVDGLGLGLSIVEHLAAALEAPLHFESAPGIGTRAGVTLEAAGDHADSLEAERPVVEDKAWIEGAPLVLVIEDDEAVRDGLTRLLTGWRCRAIGAESATQALSLLSLIGEAPAFAIIDKRLRDGENGLDALEAVRKATGKMSPAALLTGDTGGFGAARNVEKLALLTKPVEPAALRALIAAAVADPVKDC